MQLIKLGALISSLLYFDFSLKTSASVKKKINITIYKILGGGYVFFTQSKGGRIGHDLFVLCLIKYCKLFEQKTN